MSRSDNEVTETDPAAHRPTEPAQDSQSCIDALLKRIRSLEDRVLTLERKNLSLKLMELF